MEEIFTAHQFLFAALAVSLAFLLVFRGHRLARWHVFTQFLVPLLFLCAAVVFFCPTYVSVEWIKLSVVFIIIITSLIAAFDYVFIVYDRIRKAYFSENPFSSIVPGYIGEICQSMELLAKRRLGALMVIERRDNLLDHIKGGIKFDAQVKAEILVALFEKVSSVHDGAIVITRGRVGRVKAILPVSGNPALPVSIGLRHRSAVGITEKSDAIALIASEERGEMSIAYRGIFRKAKTKQELLKLTTSALKRKNIISV